MEAAHVRWFKDIRLDDVPLVGGKMASVGELYSALSFSGCQSAEWLRAYRCCLSYGADRSRRLGRASRPAGGTG